MTSGSETATSYPFPDQTADNKVVPLHGKTPEQRKQAFTEFVRENPGLSLAGGLLAGMVVSSLLPRKPLRKLAGKAGALSEMAGVAALALGRRAIEQAGVAGSELRERGGNLAGQAEDLGEAAARRIGDLSHDAAERIGGLSHEAAGRIEKLGEAAASALGKVGVTPESIEKLGAAAASASSAAIERAGELLAPAEAKVEEVVNAITRAASDLKAKVRSGAGADHE